MSFATPMNPHRVIGVVLTGGQSSRMGQDKAALRIGGNSLLDHALSVLGQLPLQNCRISGPQDIQDAYPLLGPLGGILTCLQHLQMEADALLFIPVDMPGLTPNLLKPLLKSNKDTLLRSYQQHPLPLLIKTESEVIQSIETSLLSGKRAIYPLFKALPSQQIEVPNDAETAFANLNTPEELCRFQQEHPFT